MDRLSHLPAELRENVLFHLATRRDVANLSGTSRTWFHQVRASMVPILHRLLPRELPGSLLEDAAAVLAYPPEDAGQSAEEEHLNAWANKQLLSPLLRSNASSLLALDLLYRTIVSYINDYLSKASSLDLRVSYRCLPSWAHPSYHEDKELAHRTDENSGKLTLFSVSPGERVRLLQSFLRYELMCKINRSRPLRVWESCRTWNPSSDPDSDLEDSDDEIERLKRYEFKSSCIKARAQKGWNWDILSEFEGKCSAPPWDRDMLQCVHHYIITLYGAVCVRNASQRWREYYRDCHEPRSPGDFYFYTGTLGLIDPNHPNVLGLLAGFGFNLIHGVLHSHRSAFLPILKGFNAEIEIRFPDIQPLPISAVTWQLPGAKDSLQGENTEGQVSAPPGSWMELKRDIWKYTPGFGCDYRIHWTIYRQRAWAFF